MGTKTEKYKNKDLKKLIKNLTDDSYSYTRDSIYSALTFSITSATSLNNDLILDAEIDVDSLLDEKNKILNPVLTAEEEILQNIRLQSDCTIAKHYRQPYNLIDYIEESSVILGKKAIITFLYKQNWAGKGVTLTIINL